MFHFQLIHHFNESIFFLFYDTVSEKLHHPDIFYVPQI